MSSTMCKFKITSDCCGVNIIITDEHPIKVYIIRSRRSSSVHKQAQCLQSCQKENPFHS